MIIKNIKICYYNIKLEFLDELSKKPRGINQGEVKVNKLALAVGLLCGMGMAMNVAVAAPYTAASAFAVQDQSISVQVVSATDSGAKLIITNTGADTTLSNMEFVFPAPTGLVASGNYWATPPSGSYENGVDAWNVELNSQKS